MATVTGPVVFSQLIVLRSILSDIRDAETEQIRKLLGSIPTETKLAEMQRNSVECNSAVNPDTQQNSTASFSSKKKPKGRSSHPPSCYVSDSFEVSMLAQLWPFLIRQKMG